MAGQNRWVVLLNRSPKGPLTEEEVKTLLERGILRANDIAYLVSEGSDKSKSEWKLLWQFPEFNRRQATEAEAPPSNPEPKTPPPAPRERRQKTPPEEIQRRAMEDLPPDLMDITPEDLLPRSTQVNFKPEPAQITPISDETILQDKPESPASSSSFDIRWAYGAGAAAMLTLVVVKLPSLLTHHASENDNRAPSSHQNIDALQPMNANERHGAPGGANLSIGVGARRPSIPQSRPPAAREADSRLDTPEPPPPATNDEPIEEEAASDRTEETTSASTSAAKQKKFKPRLPTSEEEGSSTGGSAETEAAPAGESEPAAEGKASPAPPSEEETAE